MALGTYGTVRPADMSPEDVEIILIILHQETLRQILF